MIGGRSLGPSRRQTCSYQIANPQSWRKVCERGGGLAGAGWRGYNTMGAAREFVCVNRDGLGPSFAHSTVGSAAWGVPGYHRQIIETAI